MNMDTPLFARPALYVYVIGIIIPEGVDKGSLARCSVTRGGGPELLRAWIIFTFDKHQIWARHGR